jgi:hypothetical protein
MASFNTYALKQMIDSNSGLTPAQKWRLRLTLDEIARLERQVERLSRQVEDLGGTPDPGD